jgi:hypothetical protein
MDRGYAGIFQLMVSTHQTTVQVVADRCGEGHQRTPDIADALRRAPTTRKSGRASMPSATCTEKGLT